MRPEEPAAFKPDGVRRATMAVALLAVAAVGLVLWRAWRDGSLGASMEEMSPVPFFAAVALLPALGLPVTPLYILAGVMFGARVGSVGILVALALNLVICHRLAQSAMRPRLVSFLRRFQRELPDYAAREARQAARFTLLVKFAPGVPAFVKNYVLGLSGVPFAIYFGLSMLINGVYAVLLVVLGESMLEHDLSGAALPVAALALIALVALVWFRRHRAAAA